MRDVSGNRDNYRYGNILADKIADFLVPRSATSILGTTPRTDSAPRKPFTWSAGAILKIEFEAFEMSASVIHIWRYIVANKEEEGGHGQGLEHVHPWLEINSIGPKVDVDKGDQCEGWNERRDADYSANESASREWYERLPSYLICSAGRLRCVA